MAELDHIVIGAATLAQGEAYVRDALGVECAGGGSHERMGTHNRVLRLGDEAYLEVIAIDPNGCVPFMPRWFGLDGAELRAQLAQGPRLIAWVARSSDFVQEAAHLPAQTEAHIMQRGDLRWTFLFTSDGSRLGQGLLPHLIHWEPGTLHPAARLPANGLALMGLRGLHPDPQPLNQTLAKLGLQHNMVVRKSPLLEAPKLQAMIQTPVRGRVVME